MTMTLTLVDIITTHTEKTYETYRVVVIYDRNENIAIWNAWLDMTEATLTYCNHFTPSKFIRRN